MDIFDSLKIKIVEAFSLISVGGLPPSPYVEVSYLIITYSNSIEIVILFLSHNILPLFRSFLDKIKGEQEKLQIQITLNI